MEASSGSLPEADASEAPAPGADDGWVIDGPEAEHLEHDAVVAEPTPLPRRWRRVILVPVLALAGVVVFGVVTFVILYARTTVPAAPPLADDTQLFDRHGKPLATLAGDENREIVPFRRIPEQLRDAVIATEDANFYGHPGVDVVSTARAAVTDLKTGEFTQGGSTITQQLVKNLYTGDDKTISRKVNEAVLALKLEREYTKNQILAKYLNTVYFGHGAYGVEAAAQTYFDADAADLTIPESAALAGLLASPTHWDPLEHPAAAAKRRGYVLQRMAEQGYLSRARSRRLARADLPLAHHEPSWTESPSAYFVDDARQWLQARFGSEETFGGGLKVTTTLDPEWQKAAEDAVHRALPASTGPQGALVAIDPATGAIRAMVGGRDFQRSQFNLATQAERQPGSSFKTFGLVAALEAGISPLERFDGPPRIRIAAPPCGSHGQPWEVANYADETAGTMNLFDATANSVNTIFAQVVERVGPEAVASAAQQLGIRSRLDPVCPIVLGSEEVTPLELTSAYAALAANGVYHDPSPVERVLDRDGTVVATIDRAGRPALDPSTAAIVTQALQGVVTSGTGTAAALPGRPVAGKTGTAQGYTNAWFCGYVPQLAACVWMGYPEGNRPMDGVTGGSTPAEIWRDFMTVATRGMDVESFARADLSSFRDHGSSATPTPSQAADRATPSQLPPVTVTVVAPPPTTTPSPATHGGGPKPSPSPSAGGVHGSPSPSPSPRGSPRG